MTLVGLDPASSHPARPNIIRRDTDQILSYYQSADADASGDEARPASTCTHACGNGANDVTTSTSPVCEAVAGESVPSEQRPQRRTSTRSTGASDKRRVAIVELMLSDGRGRQTSSSSTSDTGHPPYSPAPSGASALLVGTFALIAPPDASPSAYTNLTPPLLSSPAVDHRLVRNASVDSATSSTSGRHQRSQSEVSAATSARPGHRLRKSSRDIGIVGTSTATSPTSGQMQIDLRVDETKTCTSAIQAAQVSPIFQTPSLSQTSLLSSDDSTSPDETSGASREVKRHLQQPLHSHTSRSSHDESFSDVLVGVNPSPMMQAPSMASVTHSSYATPNGSPPLPSPNYATSSQAIVNAYLHYQPGIHATAGPLPPPPRQIHPHSRNEPPPPRPPRLHAPTLGSNGPLAKKLPDASIEQPEQSSPAITPSTTSSTLVNSPSEDLAKGGHAREGAFPINSVIVTDATPPRHAAAKQEPPAGLKRKSTMDNLVLDVNKAIDEATSLMRSGDVSPSNVSRPLQDATNQEHTLKERRSTLELKREESRSTFKGGSQPSSPSSDYSDDGVDQSKPLPEPLGYFSTRAIPTTQRQAREPSLSSHKMHDFAMKRFSALPRTPSKLSVSNTSEFRSLSQDRTLHDITSPRPKVIIAKIKSAWPDAMKFADVMAKKGSLERSLGYARKINELANHDPGLAEWVVSTRHNLTTSRNTIKRTSISPSEVRSPSEQPVTITFQPRHPSRSSISSEMTFPKRVDAYVATDLSYKPSEDQTLPQGPPPALPYPTLVQGAQVIPSRSLGGCSTSSVRSIPSTLGSSKSGGGFFSSIGRKTSMKKERAAVPNVPSNKLLNKRQHQAAPAPRPVQIDTAPLLPGGPRAPPGRTQRAQSVIAPRTLAAGLGHAHVESETEATRRMSTKRSPSVAPSMARSATVPAAESAPNFDKQVSKLADLLPHADRSILAAYLRRAGGQDILAIGRYLDDEKNNCLRRD